MFPDGDSMKTGSVHGFNAYRPRSWARCVHGACGDGPRGPWKDLDRVGALQIGGGVGRRCSVRPSGHVFRIRSN